MSPIDLPSLGAHPTRINGDVETTFSVWAPNAVEVAVVGDFNQWHAGRNNMVRDEKGIWSVSVPGAQSGDRYKFLIKGASGITTEKIDPYAFRTEAPPHMASIVHDPTTYDWRDQIWLEKREGLDPVHSPLSIYEVHLGSWAPCTSTDHSVFKFRSADLIDYVKSMGFTHIELLPIAEYPFGPSWGYQPLNLFSPTARYGNPDELQAFVDQCHQAGIGVILDWVVAHFPADKFGLTLYDGTPLYENEDERMRYHPDWGTLIFDFSSPTVGDFLIENALFWFSHYHIDGMRVDAVSSMLYLDYSRASGEWVPNRRGTNVNDHAVNLIRRLNTEVHARIPGAIMIAEESSLWPGVSRSVEQGGLGFDFKWNLGWMHEALNYVSSTAEHREKPTDMFSDVLSYASSENWVLPISHDEVVHGKRSLVGKMSEDRWRQFASVRALYLMMYAFPGKKLSFMGNETGTPMEWDFDSNLDWSTAGDPFRAGLQTLIKDLNEVYRTHPAMYANEEHPDSVTWLHHEGGDWGTVCFARGHDLLSEALIFCINFGAECKTDWEIGAPVGGAYEVLLNSDAHYYGGCDAGSGGLIETDDMQAFGQPYSLTLTLPPIGGLILRIAEGCQLRSS